jgi:hypothetical protein
MRLARRTTEAIMRASIAAVVFVGVSVSSASAQTAPPPQKSGERYKSVRVLTDTLASDIIPMMSVIAGSLGVTCAHCHESDFASDANPMKQRAREMMHLTRTTAAAFGGAGKITCNTCHQGHAVPPAYARVEQAAWLSNAVAMATPAPLPTAESVFARYLTVVGGQASLDRISTRTISGTVTRDNGRTGPVSGTFSLQQTMPGSARMDTEFSFPPEARSELNAEFFRPRRAAALAARSRVIGRGVVRSRPTIVVEVANATTGSVDYRLHFDAADGVLVARESERQTPLGILAERHELSDYREVNGVSQPFRIEWLRFDYHVTFTITDVK